MQPQKQESAPTQPQNQPEKTEATGEMQSAQIQPESAQAQQVTEAPRVPRVTLQAADVPFGASSGQAQVKEVEWRAKEYIAPEKNMLWYVGLFAIVAAGIALDIFVLKAWTVSLLLVAIAAVLIVMTVRPSRDIKYKLSRDGLLIDNQLYALNEYKAFGVIHDGKENSVFLIPVKRFKPGLSVYFPVESGEQIVDILGQYLPMQEIHLDFIDKVVRFLRL